MQKRCKCGNTMTVRLRTVIYSNRVEIDNVPVYCCEDCKHSEVLPSIKTDLTDLIGELGDAPEKQLLDFHERNELANVMLTVCTSDETCSAMMDATQNRIDELLDLLLLAKSLPDSKWEMDIRRRLAQISMFHQERADV